MTEHTENALLGALLVPAILPGMSKGHQNMAAVPWFVGQFVMTWAKHERMLCDMLARIFSV